MSEQQPSPQPTSPEVTTTRHFTAADMDDLRDEQKDYYVENMMWLSPDEKEDKNKEADEAYNRMIAERLKNKGIEEDHPEYAAHVALLSNYSINNAPDSRWDVGSADEYGIRGKSMREEFNEKLGELQPAATVDDQPDTPEQPDEPKPEPEAEDNEKLTQLDKDVESVRKHFADLLAKRSKRSLESAKTAAQIDATHEELTDLISATATEMMDALEATGSTPEAISAAISNFIGQQIDAVTSEMEAARAADYLNRGKWTKKALDKWASWGGGGNEKFFSKDRFKGNLKKGAVFAVPGAIVAGVAAPLVGAVAGTAAVGVGAAYLSRKVARTLAGAKLDSMSEAETIAHRQTYDIKQRMDAAGEGALHSDLLGIMKERSSEYRKRNRNRLIAGVAISSAVGVLGSVAGDAAADYIGSHDVNWKGGRAGEWLQNKFSGNDSHDTPGSNTPDNHAGLSDHEKHIQHQNHVNHENHVDHQDHINHENHVDHTTGGANEQGLNWSEFSANAHTVTPGEGWNQTMKELGIPRDHWAETLQSAGPKLHEQGWAYFDKGQNEWRISRPGKLPVGVLKTIAASSKKTGFTLAA